MQTQYSEINTDSNLKLEDAFKNAQNCVTDLEFIELAESIQAADPKFSYELGLDLFFFYLSNNLPDNIENFDQRIIKISYLIAYYNLELAKKFLIYHRQTAGLYSKSYIRYTRIVNAIQKSDEGIKNKIKNGLSTISISPKMDESFAIEEIRNTGNVNKYICDRTDWTNATKLVVKKRSSSPSNLDTVDVDSSLKDDYEEFCQTSIASISNRKHLFIEYYLLENVAFSLEPSGIVFSSESRHRYLYSANGIYHHFRVCGKTVLSNIVLEVPLAFVVPRKGASNYYHSLVDILPCFIGYQLLGLNCSIVYSHDLTEVEEYIIASLGICTSRLIDSREKPVTIEKAIVPIVGSFRYEFYNYCSNTLAPNSCVAGAVCNGEHDYIYISRLNSGKRPLSNECDVEAVMRKHGIAIVRMEDYSVDEQISIASNATLIIGPHGAGLTNMVFANECTVLELIPRKYLTPLFCQLAKDCGHRYSVLIGDMESSGLNGQQEFSWNINLERLDSLVTTLVSKSSNYKNAA